MSGVYVETLRPAAKAIGDDLSRALRELLQPWPRGEKVQFAIDRAAHRAGLPYWRAYNILYGKARVIDHAERDAILEAVERKRDEELRDRQRRVFAEAHELAALLAQEDPSLDRPASRAAGGMDAAPIAPNRAVGVRK